jgi:hypothetical protein
MYVFMTINLPDTMEQSFWETVRFWVEKLPSFYVTQKFTTGRHWATIQTNPVKIITTYFIKYILILLSHSNLSPPSALRISYGDIYMLLKSYPPKL